MAVEGSTFRAKKCERGHRGLAATDRIQNSFIHNTVAPHRHRLLPRLPAPRSWPAAEDWAVPPFLPQEIGTAIEEASGS